MIIRLLIIIFVSLQCAITQNVKGQTVKGRASYYGGPKFHGKLAADGSRFDQNKLTAASNYFDLGTVLHVFRVKDGDTLSTQVKVTDRMSEKWGKRRKLDLSKKAMAELEGINEGVIDVHINRM